MLLFLIYYFFLLTAAILIVVKHYQMGGNWQEFVQKNVSDPLLNGLRTDDKIVNV